MPIVFPYDHRKQGWPNLGSRGTFPPEISQFKQNLEIQKYITLTEFVFYCFPNIKLVFFLKRLVLKKFKIVTSLLIFFFVKLQIVVLILKGIL